MVTTNLDDDIERAIAWFRDRGWVARKGLPKAHSVFVTTPPVEILEGIKGPERTLLLYADQDCWRLRTYLYYGGSPLDGPCHTFEEALEQSHRLLSMPREQFVAYFESSNGRS